MRASSFASQDVVPGVVPGVVQARSALDGAVVVHAGRKQAGFRVQARPPAGGDAAPPPFRGRPSRRCRPVPARQPPSARLRSVRRCSCAGRPFGRPWRAGRRFTMSAAGRVRPACLDAPGPAPPARPGCLASLMTLHVLQHRAGPAVLSDEHGLARFCQMAQHFCGIGLDVADAFWRWWNSAWQAPRIQPEFGCSKRRRDPSRKSNRNRRRGRQAVHALLAIRRARPPFTRRFEGTKGAT